MENTEKYLRAIAAVAVVLTILVIGYTMSSALNGNRSFNANRVQQAAGHNPHLNLTGDPVPENLFPVSLAGMVRVQSLAGQAAIDAVSSMHGTRIKLKTAYVVAYQGLQGSQMTILFAETQNEQDAAALFQGMDAKMPGNPNFSNYRNLTIDAKQYKSVTGMELQNYYWLTGKRVMWVGIGGVQDSAVILKQIVSLY